jgi:hypothetical protein
MSKASEWFDTIYPSCPSVATIQAIIDDARAGMVPEGELAAVKAELEQTEAAKSRDSINGDCIMLMREHLARVGIESTFADDAADLAAQTIEKLRAELAKAWEAGRADTIGVVFQHCQPGNGSLFAAIDDDAAKLQPPGGKAK